MKGIGQRFNINRDHALTVAIWMAFYMFVAVVAGYGQRGEETFTGTVISYGSGFNTRVRSSTFTLRLTGQTSDAAAQRLLNVLQDDGQTALLRAINDKDLGRFSIGGSLGRNVNVVTEALVDGRIRIYVVFERWMQFGELRASARSVDYPFGFIELYIDPKTGRGEGTYIAAARIRFKDGNIEVEDFGTYPARLLGVRTNRRRS